MREEITMTTPVAHVVRPNHSPASEMGLKRRVRSSGGQRIEPAPDTLGWTLEEARVTRARLSSFAEDWEAPGMEAYDRD
jgi:hypothetical protein